MTNPLLEEPVSHSLTLAMNEKSTSVTPDGEMCNVQQAKHPNLSRARTLAAAALLALSNLVPVRSPRVSASCFSNETSDDFLGSGSRQRPSDRQVYRCY